MKEPVTTSAQKTPRRLRLSLGGWQRLVRQIDSRSTRVSFPTAAAYWLSGAANSLLSRIQHASHADKIRTVVPAPPLFLLGFWRSGTTFLHELFCCDTRFGFASTYACMNPSHFLLTEKWAQQRATQQSYRPMDNMLYSWASPQEDEFALFATGAPSAYEAVIFPSLMRNARLLLDVRQRSPEELNRWKDSLQYLLRLLTVQQQGQTMVLKSPPHGFRLPILPQLFPLARYVILERNPYEVFASNLKLWHSLIDLYGVEPASQEEIETFVLAAYVLHEDAIAEGVRDIDPRLIARVRYEALIADPVRQMALLYEQLDLKDFAAAQPNIERHIASVAYHKRNRFRVSPTQKQRVDAFWGPLIRGKGYVWPDDHVTLE